MAATNSPEESYISPRSIRVISLNCWGLKFLSKHRHARLSEIGAQLGQASPAPQIVGLQECWTQEDYLAIRRHTEHILPYSKYYFSGIFGGGLAILSKWPIVESTMYRYPLNGRPAAFYRGDWYVGKGVACATIKIGTGERDLVDVFCTHLHAPYAREPNDTYMCHRTAQAWEIARLMRHAVEKGRLVLGLGDFNMVPSSLAYGLITAHAPVQDVWRSLHPDSAVARAHVAAERARGKPVPSADECLAEHGTTCDSLYNTWRWEKQRRKMLDQGHDLTVDGKEPNPRAERLDYIFFGHDDSGVARHWAVEAANVGMLERHPTLKCSLSDHFSVEATLVLKDSVTLGSRAKVYAKTNLAVAAYDEILTMIHKYEQRERLQRRLRLAHFGTQCFIAIGCLVAVWWSPRNYVSFILMLISTLGLSAGVIDGLMGGLFVGSELRALKEFEWEISNARALAFDGAEKGSGTKV